MKAKLIANPYIVYSISFLVTMIIYTLHWSDLYPHLSAALFLFLIGTSFVSAIIGVLLQTTNYLSYEKVTYSPYILWFFSILILLSYLTECAYMGVIPLF